MDDNPDHLELLADLLRERGYEVTEARDASEALRLISDQKPQACVIDIRLPDIDGPEVARRLRADPRTSDLPIVALTSLGPDEAAGLLELGFDGYLDKPIDVRSFPGQVRAFAAKRPGGSAAVPGRLAP